MRRIRLFVVRLRLTYERATIFMRFDAHDMIHDRTIKINVAQYALAKLIGVAAC